MPQLALGGEVWGGRLALAPPQQKEKTNKNSLINKNKTCRNKNYFLNSRTRLQRKPHTQTNHCRQQM